MATHTDTQGDVLEPARRHGHWVLRFALASVFLYQGVDKFMGGGIGGFASVMELPWILGLLVALTEIAAGALVVIGAVTNIWITRLGALLVVPVMLGAIVLEHWGQWHFMATATHPLGGMQFQVTVLMIAVYLLIHGNDA